MTYDSKCPVCAKRFESVNGWGAPVGGRFCSLRCVRVNLESELDALERAERAEARFDEASKA